LKHCFQRREYLNIKELKDLLDTYPEEMVVKAVHLEEGSQSMFYLDDPNLVVDMDKGNEVLILND